MKKFIAVLLAIVVLMYVEYRYIMTNMELYYAEDGFVYIDVLGQVDTYYAEPIFSD